MNECLNCRKSVRNKYCNVSCQNLRLNRTRRIERISKYDNDPIKCLFCSGSIDYDRRRNKFCTVSCANKYRGKDTLVKTCNSCNKPISNKFELCLNCHTKDAFDKFIEGNFNIKTSQAKKILKSINRGCQRCEWDKKNVFTNKIPLEMHHRDGNKDNNLIGNLEILCPNCHSLTKNFRVNSKGKKVKP